MARATLILWEMSLVIRNGLTFQGKEMVGTLKEGRMQGSTLALRFGLGVGPSDVNLSCGWGWHCHCHSKNSERTQFSSKQDSTWQSNSSKCLLRKDLPRNLHTELNGRVISKFPARRRIFIVHSTLKNNKSTMDRTGKDFQESKLSFRVECSRFLF